MMMAARLRYGQVARVAIGAALLVALPAACLQDFEQFVERPAGSCIVGESSACVGPQGCQGMQVCLDGGMELGPCECGAGGSGGAGGAGTGGAGQGGNGATGGSAACGNGALDAGEGCDDGAAVSGDGCDDSCAVEGQADSCPSGVEVDLSAAGIWISDTTAGKNSGNSTTCGGNSAGDMAYRFMPAQDGDVTVTLQGAHNKVLAARSGCNPGGGDVFCERGAALLTGNVTATTGTRFHVIVTGRSGAEGPFVLHLSYD